MPTTKAMKTQKYYVIFVYILHFVLHRKKQKENHATKVTKIPKTKRWKYGMNETFVTFVFSSWGRKGPKDFYFGQFLTSRG